ncbi:hypothetical protein HQ308_22170 [Rhodococcus sp. BP-241]|uniref:hypothetical protein n=1 Tax=Rhodococcus sp. BP-241 TaxID=2739441 RepID=UPI001C9A4940|nr:hypothetical protein [Rhodococcus sp. BP-241]MBY6709502.1 hypothetical protein [Rhodococcus sp. BP-241]
MSITDLIESLDRFIRRAAGSPAVGLALLFVAFLGLMWLANNTGLMDFGPQGPTSADPVDAIWTPAS